ncbi:MAG: 50S ribosomal protein L4 [Synergistetes bacterium]|nr:50S ribosomal protein L4 [Synergistota bacterium]MCX8128071.1 50S ribosomal protein L4 [Synergistota bacterium]MDW8192447.1 50S ribosomal protein L4 [Synergistota bacterium]
MPKVAVLDVETGKVKREIEVNPKVFEAPLHRPSVHQAVIAHLANLRQGTACTKTRGEVRGGGRKPWRQKGTGRARHGSIRSPLWVGGGVVFGPKPRDYDQKIPKKVRKLALRAVLTSKFKEGNIIVLDNMKLDAPPKTKKVIALLNKLGIRNQKSLIITDKKDEIIQRSARNLPNVNVLCVNNINVYDLLLYDKLIMTEETLKRIEEVCGNE